MFLSDRAEGVIRPIEEHETAELLLEYCEFPRLAIVSRLTDLD